MKKAFILLNLVIILCFAQTNLITQEMLDSCVQDKNTSICEEIMYIKSELYMKEYETIDELRSIACDRGDDIMCENIKNSQKGKNNGK